MPNETFSSLALEVRRNEDQGVYEFGTNIEGAYVVFATRKLGGIDSDREDARAVAAQTPPPEPQQA